MKRGEVAQNVSRGVFFLGLEKGVAMISTMLYFALMARWLGPTKYGMLTIAFSIVTLATAFTGNFEMFLERYAAEYQVQGRVETLRRAYRIALGVKLALGVLASVLLVALAPWLAERYKVPELRVLLPLLTVFVATDGLATTGRSALFGLQRFEWVSGFSLIFNVGKTFLVGALWGMKLGLRELAVGFSALTFVQATVICLASLWVLSRLRPAADTPREAVESHRPLFRAMLRYCLPLYGARLSFMSGQNLGKLVLGLVLDTTTLGYFTLAFNTVERFVEVVNTLPQALLPSFTQIVALGDRERLRYVVDQAFRLIQLVACALSFTLFVFAHEIVRLVGSPLFEPAIPLLRVLALVPIVRTAQQPLTMLFQALGRPVQVLRLAMFKLFAELGGYGLLVLLASMGAMGACWANFTGAVVSFTGALVFAAAALPEGREERIGAFVRNVLLLAPSLFLSVFAERELGIPRSLPIRIFLVVPSLVGVFALGLVTRYDLSKLSSLTLPGTLLPRVRDHVVAGADRMARAFEYRSAA